MAASSKYNQEYHDDWAWSLAIKGATNDDIAEAFGISTRTFIRWTQQFDSLKKAVVEGKNIADSKIEKSLYQKARGMKIKDEERIIEMDKDGNAKPIRIKTVTREIPPDTMAMMYWLNNRKRGQWSQRQEVALSAADNDTEDVVIYLPELENGE